MRSRYGRGCVPFPERLFPRANLSACPPQVFLYVNWEVVARDGIEPPTPAFSGPRSTTELSGLGRDYTVSARRQERHRAFQNCAPSAPLVQRLSHTSQSQGRDPRDESARQTQAKYSNLASLRQTLAHPLLSRIQPASRPVSNRPPPITPADSRYPRLQASPQGRPHDAFEARSEPCLCSPSSLCAADRPDGPRSAPRSHPSEARAVRAFNRARQSPLDLRAFLVRMPKGATSTCISAVPSTPKPFSPTPAPISSASIPNAQPGQKRRHHSQHSTPARLRRGPRLAQPPPSAPPRTPSISTTPSSIASPCAPSSPAPAPAHTTSSSPPSAASAASKSPYAGEWLDEVATRAASQNEQYLEVMETPPFPNAARLASETDWPRAAPSATAYPQHSYA